MPHYARGNIMDRRTFLKSARRAGAFVASAGFATPAISQRAGPRTVRLAPHADLANFDPIWTPAYIVRNAGLLVWDMLYGVDATLTPQRQMVEAEEVSADGLTWTFRLRPGLKFHDGEPVLARDAVASVSRWSARDPMGQMVKAIQNELVAVDDRTFRWVLRKPYPKLLLALGKVSTPCCFIMPARIAATDPFKQINDYVGSGPMRFARSEWVPGARAAFEKFADYLPRGEEPSWLAGGKRIVADRIEWIVMPDATTGAAALQTGEIDWLEFVVPDLVPMLRKNRNLMVEINDPLGLVGILAMNQLFPPFNDVRARRAILMALNQEEYMHAFVGTDEKMWKPMPSYFTPATPLYNEEGGDIFKGPRRLDAAKRLLAESGYAGEPIVCMAAQDLPHHKAWGEVTVDLLKRLDVNVDFAAVDWGTVVARRPQKKPPRDGGWHIYVTSPYGVDLAAPISGFMRGDGTGINGWATSPAVEAELAAWFDATDLEQEKAIARRLNKAAAEDVLFAPLGVCMRHYAWRKSLTGITQGPLPLFWGVSKTV
jgi:peptide/nickel transport system substrate-binding protein